MKQTPASPSTEASEEPSWVGGVLLAATNAVLGVAAALRPSSAVPIALTFAVGYLSAAFLVARRRWRRTGSMLLTSLAALELASLLYSFVFHVDWIVRPTYLLHVGWVVATLLVARTLSRAE